MEPFQILIAAIALSLGSLVQGVAGFGLGLVALPLLLFAGIHLPAALILLIFSSTAQSLYNLFIYREHFCWRDSVAINGARLAFMPIGLAILYLIGDSDPSRVRQIVGVAILATVAAQYFLRVKPVEKLHWGWTLLAGGISGIMGSAIGIGGPPFVLWCQAHNWSTWRFRTCMWSGLIALALPMLVALVFMYGATMYPFVGVAVLLVPLSILGGKTGSRLGGRLDSKRLRIIVFALLFVTGLTCILDPYF
jgi:uncharacterized membrane protein YfcA